MGKRQAAASSGRRVADASEVAAPSSGRRRGKSGQAGPVPLWVWVAGGFALVLCLGRLFPPSSSTGSRSGRHGGGKVSARFLELASRLQDITQILVTPSDKLDAEAFKGLEEELRSIEAAIAKEEGSTARDALLRSAKDLLSTISVARGTSYQRSGKFSDEEVDSHGDNSFTYANPRYWEGYYNKTSSEDKFDWYTSWNTPIVFDGTTAVIGDLLRAHLSSQSRILMFGCGNSELSEKMYGAGYQDIVNIDISSHVLDLLRERLAESMPKMRWLPMNVSAMTFSDGVFDIVLDKGTLDAIEDNKPLARAAIAEAYRVLQVGGRLISVTYEDKIVRVEGQLKPAADWGECETFQFELQQKHARSERRRFFLHVCRKLS